MTVAARVLLACAVLGAGSVCVRAQQAPPPPPPPPGAVFADSAFADTSGLFDPDALRTDDLDPEVYSLSGVRLDTAARAPRPVPRATLDRFRADPDYRYDGRTGERGPSLLSRLWDWFWRTYLRRVQEAVDSRPGQAALVFLAFVLLIALAFWLVGKGGGGLFGRRDAAHGEAGDVLLDVARIEDVDLGALLARARTEGRYREATRFRYLLGLQRLAAAGLLVWDRHKTDGDYLRELRRHARPPLTAAFADAARAFAWVWYGEAPLDAARFARVEALLDRLDAAIPPSGEAAA